VPSTAPPTSFGQQGHQQQVVVEEEEGLALH
jgi:hypothetical protein